MQQQSFFDIVHVVDQQVCIEIRRKLFLFFGNGFDEPLARPPADNAFFLRCNIARFCSDHHQHHRLARCNTAFRLCPVSNIGAQFLRGQKFHLDQEAHVSVIRVFLCNFFPQSRHCLTAMNWRSPQPPPATRNTWTGTLFCNTGLH